MKRILSCLLILAMVLPLLGCSFFSREEQEPVMFYYRRKDFGYGHTEGIIASEERDGTGHITDYTYLLNLYLMGPMSEELISPFPEGLQILDAKNRTNLIRVTVSEELDTLSQSQLSLALACLTLTCVDLSGHETVVIVWGENLVTMDRSQLTLYDDSTIPTQ